MPNIKAPSTSWYRNEIRIYGTSLEQKPPPLRGTEFRRRLTGKRRSEHARRTLGEDGGLAPGNVRVQPDKVREGVRGQHDRKLTRDSSTGCGGANGGNLRQAFASEVHERRVASRPSFSGERSDARFEARVFTRGTSRGKAIFERGVNSSVRLVPEKRTAVS